MVEAEVERRLGGAVAEEDRVLVRGFVEANLV